MKCTTCKDVAVVALPSHHAGFCEKCFLSFFNRQLEKAIRRESLFTFEDKILVALSGGKDSLALMLALFELGYDVTGLHVDLSIPVSSQKARVAVENFCEKHNLDLIVKDMGAEGLAIPKVKKCFRRPICSVCGKIKRYFFNKAALDGGFTVMATGHNLDDEIARLFSNVLRWDASYLGTQGPMLPDAEGFVRKVKPFFRLTEFETANYAFLKGIDWHFAPCPYSPGATFTSYKVLWNELEEKMPGRKLDFYTGFLKEGRRHFVQEAMSGDEIKPCDGCEYPTTAGTCSICRIRKEMQSFDSVLTGL